MGDSSTGRASSPCTSASRCSFVNVGKIVHTVADTDRKGRIRSKLIRPRALEPRAGASRRFARPGVVDYLCTFHPTLMRGTICREAVAAEADGGIALR